MLEGLSSCDSLIHKLGERAQYRQGVPFPVARTDLLLAQANPDWFMQDAKGCCGLTPQGIQRSVLLRVGGKNVSCIWLEGQMQHHNLYNRLISSVSKHPSVYLEAQRGEIVDHVHNYMARVIARDSFKKSLAEGRSLSLSVLKGWCIRSIFSTIRNRGKDGHMRTFNGALSERERISGIRSATNAPDWLGVHKSFVEGDEKVTLDVEDTLPLPDAGLHLQRGLEKVEQAMRSRKAVGANQFSKFFGYLIEERSISSVAALEGLSYAHASSYLTKARTALRGLRTEINDTLVVQEYLLQHPTASLGDLQASVEVSSPVQTLLKNLGESGQLSPDHNHPYRLSRKGEDLFRYARASSPLDVFLSGAMV